MYRENLPLFDDSAIPARLAKRTPVILSASRRTDLPGFYPIECALIIRNKVKSFRTRFLYGVMFWTKQPFSFLHTTQLRSLVEELNNPVVQLTITGLGGTRLEPEIPQAGDIINALPELISLFKNDPRRIRWRFDPILRNQNDISHFEYLAQSMSSLGILECTISFPTYFSLKGNLKPQFVAAQIPEWDNSAQFRFLDQLVTSADRYDIRLKVCAQPAITSVHPEITAACCIDGALFKILHPEKLALNLTKDRSQRAHCHCVQSEDIGSYTRHPCRGGCLYCYSKAGGPKFEEIITNNRDKNTVSPLQ